MIGWIRRHRCDDEGSILLALFAMLVVSGLLTVGLTMIVMAHTTARHDLAFEAALTGAEEGLSELVAQVKDNPDASSFTPISGTDPTTHVSYSASATPSGGQWLVDATGTAPTQNGTVTRHIQVNVRVDDLLDVPLFGDRSLSLGGPSSSNGSAVDQYDSSSGANASNVCDRQGNRVSMDIAADTRMCSQASPALGVAATNGDLHMRTADLDEVYEADIFNYLPSGTGGRCVEDGGVCAQLGNKVKTHVSKLNYPLATTMCSQGIGAGSTAYDGSAALAANAVYNFSDVTLNATAVANLANLADSQIIICFNGTLTVQPLVGVNSQPATDNPLMRNPRAPSTLLLISTAPNTATGTAPVVQFGAGLPGETSLSAVVYAPNADCTATGHVDVYGLLVCGKVEAPNGLDVHYDRQIALMASFQRPVTVSHWREVH